MATYFKYAERSAESQINWAEVGKNMTDMLQEQERIRDEKISALDAATRELGEKLANPPQGEHKSANQWALEYGDNASEYMLMQEKLFKSGKMKTKDYLVSRQNLVDGTKQAFNLTKEFQETFKMKMDRYKNGESQDLELFLNAQAEKFGDFTKSQLYINPTDGSVNVAMKERRVIGGKEVFVMNQNPMSLLPLVRCEILLPALTISSIPMLYQLLLLTLWVKKKQQALYLARYQKVALLQPRRTLQAGLTWMLMEKLLCSNLLMRRIK